MNFVEVCPASELEIGEAAGIDHDGTPIAVFNIGGEFCAVDEKCTHGDWSLREGYVEGDTVECSLHCAKFCLRTGAVAAPPASKPLKIYPVKIQDGLVFVDVEGGHYANNRK